MRVRGVDAIGWMMTLYSLMGQRRKAKIRECIAYWKTRPGKGRHFRPMSEETKRKIGARARISQIARSRNALGQYA
jgi:hypothetical protein